MTMAEHALYRRLCEYHNPRIPDPFPKRSTFAFEFEKSRIYITQIFQSLERKRFIKRKRRPQDPREPQESNGYEIDFTRWFPYKDDGTERQNKQMLGYFRRSVPTPQLAQGFLAAWIEPKSPRSKRPRQTLWIAIESRSMDRFLDDALDRITAEIKTDTGMEFDIRRLDTYIRPDDDE